MRVRACIPTRCQIAKAALIIAMLMTSARLYHRHTVAKRNMYEKLPSVALELATLANLTWKNPAVQMHIHRALGHVLATLEAYHGKIPQNLLHVARTAAADKNKRIPLVVCPEEYLGTAADYPWFEKGRVLTKCPDTPLFQSVISILLNGHEFANDKEIVGVLREIHAIYPGLTVIVCVRRHVIIPLDLRMRLDQVVIGEKPTAENVWNRLVHLATTEYVLIGRRIERFLWYALLERMVRVASELDVAAVGASLRTPDGHWSMGCQQTVLRNYTLTYRAGYDLSTNSCAYCNYISSPFVTRLTTLQAFDFRMTSADTVFHDFFLRLQRAGKLVMSCPDSMFFVRANNEAAASSLTRQWAPMAVRYRLNRVNLADGRHLTFSCSQVATYVPRVDGIIVPVCAIGELLEAILRVMDICKQIGLYCQLEGNTALGAMKFNGILPWARGANITYITSKNVSFWDHRDGLFAKFGYELSLGDPKQPAESGANVVRRPQYILVVPGWRIQLFGWTQQSTTDVLEETAATKLSLGGRWVNAPTNPGLYALRQYGTSDYLRHPKTLKKCPNPEGYECLDQYPADGNVNFIYQ